MASRPRNRSANITLVLIGAAALAGCDTDSAQSRRTQYASKEACLADWGDPKECEEVAQRSSSGSRGSYWYGPSRPSGSSSGTKGSSSSRSYGGSVSRGGFGSSGHSSAS
jgi:hypothetical protein